MSAGHKRKTKKRTLYNLDKNESGRRVRSIEKRQWKKEF